MYKPLFSICDRAFNDKIVMGMAISNGLFRGKLAN